MLHVHLSNAAYKGIENALKDIKDSKLGRNTSTLNK